MAPRWDWRLALDQVQGTVSLTDAGADASSRAHLNRDAESVLLRAGSIPDCSNAAHATSTNIFPTGLLLRRSEHGQSWARK